MKSPPRDLGHTWMVAQCAAAIILLVAGFGFVPIGSLPFPPTSTYSDAQVSHWPNAYFLRQSVLAHNELPLWNPLRMLGQPFAANPLSKVWYPPQWLVLIFPPTFHLDLLVYLHLALLGAGVVAWARGEKLRPITGLFAALAWGLNAKLIAHLGAGHLDILYALSWLPWLLWSARRAIERAQIGPIVQCGAVGALILLADIRMAFYMFPVAALYGITVSGLKHLPGARWWMGWGLSVLILALLSAVQVVPLLASSPFLTRSSLTPLEAAEYSLPPRYLLGLILPDRGGLHEWMTYLGLPVLGCVGVISVKSQWRRSAIWWAVIIVAVLWSLGKFGPLFMPLAERLPEISWLRVPSRAWFVVGWCAVMLAAYGLDRLISAGLGRIGRLVSAAVSFAGLTALMLGTIVSPGLSVIIWLGSALFATGAGFWLAGGTRKMRIPGVMILLATQMLSLIALDLTLIKPQSVAELEAQEGQIITRLNPTCRSVYSPTFDLIGPATAESGLAVLNGVDPFQLRVGYTAIAQAAGVPPGGYSVIAPPMPPGQTDLSGAHPDTALLRAIGVCEVVSQLPVTAPGLREVGKVDNLLFYAVEGQDKLDQPGHVTHYWRPQVWGVIPESMETCLPGGQEALATSIVIPQVWMEGWRAWLDGNPVEVRPEHGGAFLRIDLPAHGCHKLSLAYQPIADAVGFAVSAATLAVITVAWMVKRRSDSKRASNFQG